MPSKSTAEHPSANPSKKPASYSIRVLEDMAVRAIKRHHIKAVAHKDGTRTLYYFDGRIYRNELDVVRRLLASEEAAMYLSREIPKSIFTYYE